MISCKLESSLAMCQLEHGDFLLGSRVKSSFLQCIPDSLGMDRVCEGKINEICSLNSIVKPPRVDLLNNGLLITGRELGGTATRIVLFVKIHFLPNFADSTKLMQTMSHDIFYYSHSPLLPHNLARIENIMKSQKTVQSMFYLT